MTKVNVAALSADLNNTISVFLGIKKKDSVVLVSTL